MQLVINEISSSAPQALQAIKLLAQYQGNKLSKVWPPLLPSPCMAGVRTASHCNPTRPYCHLR
jgi:hypothetical protein